jgi:4-carboxymuconolactone decarboxylase
MVRFSISPPADLAASQRAAFERIVGERGKLPKPYATLLASPKVSRAGRARCLASCGTVRYRGWCSKLCFSVWRELRTVSISGTTTKPRRSKQALRRRVCPRCKRESFPRSPRHLHRRCTFVDEMQTLKHVRDSTFDAAMAHFGAQGVSELCAFLGFATTIAFLLNAQQGDAHAAAESRLMSSIKIQGDEQHEAPASFCRSWH